MTKTIKPRIPLVQNTISGADISALISFLEEMPQLTIGQQVAEFERQWSQWLGVKHSVMVNSGSTANLAMLYALIQAGKLSRGDTVLCPAVSWVTTVAPVMQLGLKPILVDADPVTLGVDPVQFEKLASSKRPKAAIIVHVLGVPCRMEPVLETCRKYNIMLLEDSCETVGSTHGGKKCGTFGEMSSFSFFMGHTSSTIEGGMVSTDNPQYYKLLKMIRSHGWNRDLTPDEKQELQRGSGVDDFRALYTFYLPGFNFRPTEIQGVLGLQQMKKLDFMCQKRSENFKLYDSLIRNSEWKLDSQNLEFCSNFAYPIITSNIKPLVVDLKASGVECRPLICGSIARQPFWVNQYGTTGRKYPFADKIHNFGLYVPNNHEIREEEIEEICEIINRHTHQ